MGKLSKKPLYKCISVGLMHVAAWYHGTSPDQSSQNSGNKFKLANVGKCRRVLTKSVRDIRCRKILLPGK